MSLQTVPLSNVCEIIMGQAPVGSSYNENGEGLALIAGAGDFGQTTPEPKKYTTEASKISNIDDLILCIRATIGDLNWSDKEYCLGRGVAGLRPIAHMLDKSYLWHFIGANKNQLSAKGTGSTFKQVSRSHIAEWEIPLPPLAEQKRIAAILDKADAIRRKRQQAIQLADDFLRAVFLDMFGDPVTNPKGWEVKRLGDVTSSQLGKMLSQKAKSGSSPFKYLRNANVRWRDFNLDDLLEMDFNEKEQKKFTLESGDLLVCEGGEVGRCAIWRGENEACFYQKALHRVRPNYTVLTSEYLQEYFFWMARKGGLSDSVSEVTFSHLTAERLKELKIPIPPIHIQKNFSDIYMNYLRLNHKSKDIGSECQVSINALSQKAFRGEL